MARGGYRWLFLGLALLLLAGCGGSHPVKRYLDDHYTLDALRPSAFRQEEAFVYRTQEPVPRVAESLAGVEAPRQQTQPPRDDRMVLVYDNYVVDVYQDTGKPGDTLVVWQSRQFVQDHYDGMSFFQGYLAAEIVEEIFEGVVFSAGHPRLSRWDDPTYWRGRTSTFGQSVRTGSTGGPRYSGGGLFGGK